MFPIIDRFLIWEVLKTLLSVAGVLMLILASNRLVRYLADAAAGKVSGDVVFQLLGLKSLGYLGLLLAPAFFIAVLLALGRMYKDNEVAALGACGVGLSRLYRGVVLLALPATLAVAALSFYVMPWAEEQGYVIQHQQKQSPEIRGISPGRFNEFGNGRIVFYVEALARDGKTMKNVFIQGSEEGKQGVIPARLGYQVVDPQSGDRFLVLEDGVRYEGIPGTTAYRIAEFERYGVRISERQEDLVIERRKAQPTRLLMASDTVADRAELQWRLSIPLSMFVLALLAIPLSRSSPRQGRYAKLFMAVLIYVIYSNLLGVAKSWMVRDILPAWLGLWWVHGLMLAATAAVLVQALGIGWLLLLVSGKAPRP